jgi:hypothetical protein
VLLQGPAPFGEDSAKQLVQKVLMGTAVTLPLPVSALTQLQQPASPAAETTQAYPFLTICVLLVSLLVLA